MSEAGSKTSTLMLTDAEGGELVSRRWKIEVVDGRDAGLAVVRDSGTVLVGGHPDADLVLSDSTVSRYHAELQLLSEGVMVVDLGSTNGTRVGRSRIERALLTPGSEVRVGHTRLRVTPEDARVSVELESDQRFGDFVTKNPALRQILGQLGLVSETEATVLLRGETGTGKELLARAIHGHSRRAEGPLVVVDCASVTPSLLESQLFGHLKGSFTGATEDRKGAFESANGGTVFLDELGELPVELQPKLLRVLESRSVQRIGDSISRNVDVRFVAATNRNLPAMVKAKTFRSDLFYRVAVVQVSIPPLRDRPEDIILIARHYCETMSQGATTLASSVGPTLERYDWPGNARELRNVIERALALSRGKRELEPDDIFPETSDEAPASFHDAKTRVIADFERRYLEALMAKHEGNVSGAAREAGLSRNALYSLMKRTEETG